MKDQMENTTIIAILTVYVTTVLHVAIALYVGLVAPRLIGKLR